MLSIHEKGVLVGYSLRLLSFYCELNPVRSKRTEDLFICYTEIENAPKDQHVLSDVDVRLKSNLLLWRKRAELQRGYILAWRNKRGWDGRGGGMDGGGNHPREGS